MRSSLRGESNLLFLCSAVHVILSFPGLILAPLLSLSIYLSIICIPQGRIGCKEIPVHAERKEEIMKSMRELHELPPTEILQFRTNM